MAHEEINLSQCLICIVLSCTTVLKQFLISFDPCLLWPLLIDMAFIKVTFILLASCND